MKNRSKLMHQLTNQTHRNLFYLQKPEINVIATIDTNDKLNAFCRSLYDTSISFRETAFALFFIDDECVGVMKAGEGGREKVALDFFSILKTAILLNSGNVIFCHNHPSGNLIESFSDKRSSSALRKMLKTVYITLSSSIILSGKNNDFIVI